MTIAHSASMQDFVNWPDLMMRVEGDPELANELFALFDQELPPLRAQLREAFDREDWMETQRLAHKLKGMLANLSVYRGADIALKIETDSRAGDVLRIGGAVEAFDWELDQFLPVLRAYLSGQTQ